MQPPEPPGTPPELPLPCPAAWYKLTTRDMGPWARCKGPLVPPPQPWQHPLPPPPHPAPDYGAVKAKLVKALKEQPARMGQYIALAYRCAATFRQTDYQVGAGSMAGQQGGSRADSMAYLEIESHLPCQGKLLSRCVSRLC
jgi:hypothetical protein